MITPALKSSVSAIFTAISSVQKRGNRLLQAQRAAQLAQLSAAAAEQARDKAASEAQQAQHAGRHEWEHKLLACERKWTRR